MSRSTRQPRLARIDALAAVDGDGLLVSPASLIVEFFDAADADGWHNRVLALGCPADVDLHSEARSPDLLMLSRPNSVLIPGLVNAHAHLDLTHLGPRPHDPQDGFVAWVDMIRTGRHTDEAAIAESVTEGLRLSLAAGTVAVGDIAGAPRGRPSLAPWRAMRAAGARGVSFLEFFGIGKTVDRSRAMLGETLASAMLELSETEPSPMLGLQPHAPNTVARRLYREAIEIAISLPGSARRMPVGGAPGWPVATHLAETWEEREFVAHGRGPQREMLERLGVWDDSILADVGKGLHPVEHLRESLAQTRLLVAHVNDADDAAIETLAASRTSVVYCPHASAYFGAERHFGPHRYRDMLAAGIGVALGTDSIVNLPLGSAALPSRARSLQEAGGISVLREMRLLHGRDNADPITLLRMGTIHGAAALGLGLRGFRLRQAEPLAGLLAVEVAPSDHAPSPNEMMVRVLASHASPEVLFADKASGLAGILGESLM